MLQITKMNIDGLLIIEPPYFEDYRGYYAETYSKRSFEETGLFYDFVQDSHSFSLTRGTFRGIHFQNEPKSQTKLVRCTNGTILDYAVDLRKDSPTYKKWVSVVLSKENRRQFLIPKGFGHAFLSLTDNCELQYKVDELYEPETEGALRYNDPEINLLIPIKDIIISQKDLNAPLLKE